MGEIGLRNPVLQGNDKIVTDYDNREIFTQLNYNDSREVIWYNFVSLTL